MQASATRDFYASIGIDTIPLERGGKRPIYPAWPTKPSAEQWRTAPSDANIGIRHQGDVLNVECDERKIAGTFERVMAGVNGLGVSPPIVQSASRIGRHIYLKCVDAPYEVAYRNLAREVGAGELRIGVGALSVLPNSQVGGVAYELLSGNWRSIPSVQWRDLLWLLPLQRVITHEEALPVRLIFRPMTAGQNHLFDKVARAERGEAIGKYPSRSEAEAAIVSSLILNGWDFDMIRTEFKQRDTGHYHDAKRHADRYLQTTYANALGSIMSADIRQSLAAMYSSAEWKSWPGKSGNSLRATYLAVLAECYRANAVETSVSVREISEHGAIGVMTAQRALRQLANDRLITQVNSAAEDGQTAAVYRITGENDTGVTAIYPVPESPSNIVTTVPLSPAAELASRQALGPSAMTVYQHLKDFEARSISDLAQVTGRARSTVRAALRVLNTYQLAIENDASKWLLGPNDLKTIAGILDCAGLAETRRTQHYQQRTKFQDWINLRKAKRSSG